MPRLVTGSGGRSFGGSMIILAGIIAIEGAASRAEADWYPEGFWGFPVHTTPSSVEFLNQQALNRAAAASAGSSGVNWDRSKAYSNNTRDPDFFKLDIETQRAMTDRVARRPSRPQTGSRPAGTAAAVPAAPVAPSARQVAPVIPIASFFNQLNQLVWPADAPVMGELGSKRLASDQASLAVLGETKQRGVAQLATVAEARRKLLDYGHPALDYVRANLTARVSDTFHLFLQSLYESLGQAATPPAVFPAR
jgi:hypothetical protein